MDLRIPGTLKTRLWAFGLLVLMAVGAGAAWLVWPHREHEFRFVLAELDTALAEAVAADPSVGFLPRAEFETLSLYDDDALYVEGRARWFSVGAGAYTLPFIHVRAEIPMEREFWELRDGGVGVAGVRLLEAERQATATAEARPESDANRAGWERMLERMFDRVEPLGNAGLNGENWAIVAVERDGAALVFRLRRSS